MMGKALKPVWEFPDRVEQLEWLDLGYGSADDVADSLADVGRINRYLGGLHALTSHLYPRLQALGSQKEEITLIDLGTGSAELPCALVRWARRRQIRLRIIAVDVAVRHLEVARAYVSHLPEVALLCADAHRLPVPLPGVDFVISSLLMHHFSPAALAALLQGARAVARCGLIMSDLVRGRLPLIAFKLVQPIFARSAVTRHDGAVSIRRAYTPDELRAIAASAGLPQAQVHTHWPWRMTLVSDAQAGPA